MAYADSWHVQGPKPSYSKHFRVFVLMHCTGILNMLTVRSDLATPFLVSNVFIRVWVNQYKIGSGRLRVWFYTGR